MSWNLTSTAQPLNSAGTGTSNSIEPFKIITALVLLFTFLLGLVMNFLFLWVLCFRMKKTVNTTWFFHLILSHLAFTFVLPFAIMELLIPVDQTFDLVICKIVNTLLAVSMYGAVFFLTVISLDRYMSVFAPHWYRIHMNPRYATIICLVLWGSCIVFGTPYLIYQQTPKANATTVCDTEYDLPSNWGNEHERYQAKWSLYIIRLFLAYILPLIIISFCYVRIAIKMKTAKLARSSKPYKVISLKVVSIFIFLLPNFIMEGMFVAGTYELSTLIVMWILTSSLGCLYACFTPIFYLLSVHSFRAIFKKSLLSLTMSVFNEMFQ